MMYWEIVLPHNYQPTYKVKVKLYIKIYLHVSSVCSSEGSIHVGIPGRRRAVQGRGRQREHSAPVRSLCVLFLGGVVRGCRGPEVAAEEINGGLPKSLVKNLFVD